MPTQTIGAVDNEVRLAGYVAGGLAATTTVKTTGLPKGTRNLYLSCHNLSTATVVEYALNSWLTVLVTQDGGATFTDYSEEAQNDPGTADDISLDSLNTLANGDAIFLGSHLPFRGVQIDVEAANSTTNTLTADYYNGTTWVDLDETDGTASGGVSLAQDGAITFASVPAAWVAAPLRDVMAKDNEPFKPTYVQPTGAREHVSPLYWARLKVGTAAMDSDTTLNSIHILNRSERYAQLVPNQEKAQAFKRGFGGFGSIEYSTDAGTADFLANVGSGNGYFG